MAKEMMIIFVYDTELLQREEDDPASAILYFHPGWVSDQQRTSLCGQIIGTCHFLSTTFHCPRIFALQSGKFSIRMYGRYLLAIGTDRNVADWVLEHRTDTLTSLISFFHHDLEKLSESYLEPTNLSAKLYHMFETYLKILMYGGHVFFNTPMLQLPKSASHVFLEAMQLLQDSQQMNHVYGGAVLYHNKVVATQLSMNLTKQLILTDPYRIKSPAESIPVDFTLPLGVQLLKVYITDLDYQNLLQDVSMFRTIPQNLKATPIKKSSVTKPILSAMKRDQSLIFTTVPEEDGDQHSPVNIRQVKPSPDRPKSLNLKNKTTEPVRAAVPPSYNLAGQTSSVCSTPMTELSKVLHQNIVSICVNPENETNLERNNDDKTDQPKITEDKFKPSRRHFAVNTAAFDSKKLSSSSREVREKSNNDGGDDDDFETRPSPKHKSISDPIYPYFKSDGRVASHSLYRQFVTEQPLNFLDLEPVQKSKNSFSNTTNTEEWKSLEDLSATAAADDDENDDDNNTRPFSKESRKSLTLPLKSLTSEQQTSENIFSPSNRARANYGGVQLTPLMSKLSLLATEEKTSSGFCSRDATPIEFKDYRFPPPGNRRKSIVTEEIADDKKLHGTALFICGQQDMVMGLLLDEQIKNSPDTVNKLFELCTESLGKLERQLRHCLETYPGSGQSDNNGEPYSYLCMDTQWDSVERGGPWGGVELGLLTHLHRDFIDASNLTEIILRNDDSIIYGYQCGKTEVFYQQIAASSAGLPTPADHMGTVPLKARRRLERDHAIILL